MNVALFEDSGYRDLLPLTWLRACCELRCGRDLLIDKVRTHAGGRIARLFVRPELHELLEARVRPDPPEPRENWFLLNARALVTGDVRPPSPGSAWVRSGRLLAVTLTASQMAELDAGVFLDDSRLREWSGGFHQEEPPQCVALVDHPWDLILGNARELERQCRGGSERAGRLWPGVHLLNETEIRVGPGAVVKPGAVLDAEEGPIEIERDVRIEPGAVLQGPCHVGAGSIVRPNAILRGGTTIGPVCRVGGEIDATIFQGYSNKQHEGFLGHSFVGCWVNLGASTVTSDLKNTYGTIRVLINGVAVETGQRFLGAIIGDHAKTGIGTILPTGCVLGVAANVFTRGPLPKFVPSLAWLTDSGLTRFRVEKAVEIARTVMGRRAIELSPAEQRLIEWVARMAPQVEAAGWN